VGTYVSGVLQGGNPLLALLLGLAVEHALLVAMVLTGAEVLVDDLETVVALELHLVLLDALDDAAGEEDHTLGANVVVVGVVVHAVA
jgi:hypothetical protein